MADKAGRSTEEMRRLLELEADRQYGVGADDTGRTLAINKYMPFSTNRPGSAAWVMEGRNPRLAVPEALHPGLLGVAGMNDAPVTGKLTPETLTTTLAASNLAGTMLSPQQVLASGGARMGKPKPVDRVYPQYAEQYPPVGPPTMKVFKPGKPASESKLLTPEAQELAKTKLAVMKDMKEKGYEPYFPPKDRYDVDASKYPAQVDTKQTQLMAKEATRDKYDTHAGSPEATARLDEAYQRGLTQKENAGDWYKMGQLENEYIKEYGPEAGRKLFKERFADAMAATTGGAQPIDNFLMAHYGNYLKNKGEAIPPRAHQFPYPVGGEYAGSNMSQYDKMILQGRGITDDNPKRYNFAGNFTGNPNAATIDKQMSNLIDPKMDLPPSGSYGHYEKAVAERAKAAGVEPRYYQEVAWAGAKDAAEAAKGGAYKAQPMIQNINDVIERTARITGLSRQDVVRRGLVRAEIPLYSGGAPMPFVPPKPPPGLLSGTQYEVPLEERVY